MGDTKLETGVLDATSPEEALTGRSSVKLREAASEYQTSLDKLCSIYDKQIEISDLSHSQNIYRVVNTLINLAIDRGSSAVLRNALYRFDRALEMAISANTYETQLRDTLPIRFLFKRKLRKSICQLRQSERREFDAATSMLLAWAEENQLILGKA